MAKKSVTTDVAAGDRVRLAQMRIVLVSFTIRGLTPLIQHQWSDEALQKIRNKHQGEKAKTRDVRNPKQEGQAAAYRTDKGRYGVPAMAIKSAIIAAAHKDIGMEKTAVRKALFVITEDSRRILEMECDEPVINEDVVGIGVGSMDLRYRPYFTRWSVKVQAKLDTELLSVASLVTLVDRAGFGVGIGDWRPEKNGDNGRFEVDTLAGVLTS